MIIKRLRSFFLFTRSILHHKYDNSFLTLRLILTPTKMKKAALLLLFLAVVLNISAQEGLRPRKKSVQADGY